MQLGGEVLLAAGAALLRRLIVETDAVHEQRVDIIGKSAAPLAAGEPPLGRLQVRQRADVLGEVVRAAEVGWADGAVVRPLAGVRPRVRRHVLLGAEAPAAVRAGEAAGAVHQPEVRLHHALRLERLGALGAAEAAAAVAANVDGELKSEAT